MITAKEEGRFARLKNNKLLVDNRIIEKTDDTVNNLNRDLPWSALISPVFRRLALRHA